MSRATSRFSTLMVMSMRSTPKPGATPPIERVEPPEDITASLDDIEMDDLGYSETDMTEAEWQELLQPLRAQEEAWEDTQPEDEQDPLAEGRPAEPFAAETAEAQVWTR